MQVLWRFWESAETESGARANEDREQRANVLIAFIVSGCAPAVASAKHVAGVGPQRALAAGCADDQHTASWGCGTGHPKHGT